MNNANLSATHLKYRKDIDGLRAIAVLFVVVFHAFPHTLSGGFIGVDIFFVISGYLITSIIIDNFNNSSFSFSNFYARRTRRLAPALILVLVFSLAIGLFFLQNDEFKQLTKHILGGVTFTSNIIFWNEAGYFDNSADSKPLLHLWSLAIEEQFYLIWPISLFIIFNYKKLNLIFLTYFALTLFFFISLTLSYNQPVSAFFGLQSRFWEFLVGAALSFTISKTEAHPTPNNIKIQNIKSLLGCFFIVSGLWFITNQSLFPGWLVLLPVIGSALVISAGPRAFINKTILSNQIIVYIGLISYPLYLWHWPLLSFSRIILSEMPSIYLRLVLLFIAFVLSVLTYHFIESPIRSSKNPKFITTSLLLILTAIGLVAFWGYTRVQLETSVASPITKSEFEAYYLPTEGIQTLDRFESKFRHECNFYQVDKFYAGQATNIPKPNIDNSCYQHDGVSNHSVMIWGDSHAQMLNYGLRKNLPSNWQIFQVASSGCHPNPDINEDSDKNYCSRSNWFALNTIRKNKIKTVIVAQSVEHNPAQMNKIALKLESLGVEKIIFTGSSPRWTDFLPRIILRQLWPDMPERTFIGVDKNVINKNMITKRNFGHSNNHVFIDVISLFCNEQGCLTRIGKDKSSELTSWDLGHLTQTASDFLASKILAQEVVGNRM